MARAAIAAKARPGELLNEHDVTNLCNYENYRGSRILSDYFANPGVMNGIG